LDDPAISSEQRARFAYETVATGLPIPEEVLEQALGPAVIDSVAGARTVFYAGAFAADRGRWSDHGRAVEELEQRAERALAAGDSVEALDLAGLIKTLEGYTLWRRGQPAAALPLLEDPWATREWIGRWWLGGLYRELGRLRDAERVYRSGVWVDLSIEPLAQNELGKIYEQLGDYDKARESYEYFVHYWRDADPELQPMVEEARQAIIRLKGLRRE